MHIVSASGEKVGTLRSAKDGLKCPQNVSFIEESGTLILGSSSENNLILFKLALVSKSL